MKKSYYNFFFPVENNHYLAYNSLRNGMTLLPADIVQKIENGAFFDLAPEIRNELVKGGFIVEDDDFNERELAFVRYRISQYSGNSLIISVLPTLSCNLKCRYCFEQKYPGRMKEDVQEQIIVFIKSYLQRGIRELIVNWYGGEPLLCFDIIKKLSLRIIDLCRRYRVKYYSSMVSNGTLLTEDRARELKMLKINKVQVTIDGEEEVHNYRRPYKNGRGSYRDIMKNLQESMHYLSISLRINVDRSNVNRSLQEFSSIYKKLTQKKANLTFHFGHVRKNSVTCKCEHEECLTDREYWQKTLELNRLLLALGYNDYPFPDLGVTCGAGKLNSFLIGPQGELYRCWNHAGDETKVVGSIFKDIKLTPLLISYLNFSCENRPECFSCKVMPVCMGRCIDFKIKELKKEAPESDCSRWKYFLEESLRDYFLFKMKSKKNSNQKNL